MLTEICLYLKNWFNLNQSKYFGEITIENGRFDLMSEIQQSQYYRIVGSVFNDGVHKRGSEELTDETFNGAIWLMAVPQDVISLATEINMWQEKYGGVDSEAMSPFQSESYGGYSYSKASGGNSESGSSVPTWQSVFGARLRRYKKI
jgi:hypothetical protein